MSNSPLPHRSSFLSHVCTGDLSQPNKTVQALMDEEKRKAELLAATFRQNVVQMLQSKSYILNDFARDIKASLESAKSSTGVTGQIKMAMTGKPQELKDLEALVALLDSFTAEERLADGMVRTYKRASKLQLFRKHVGF